MTQNNKLFNTAKRLPVKFTHGKGVYLYDAEGNEYLDALAGVAVCALGHAHPNLTRAIQNQSEKFLHCSNIYEIQEQEDLAEKLCEISQMDKAFFCNSGAEANEGAIKLARLYGHQKGIAEPQIIVVQGAFHGRTLAALAATGNLKIQAGFSPLPSGFIRVPFGDVACIEALLKANPSIIAVMVEPIQGEGGIQLPPPNYLNNLRELCDKQDCLLMVDEIQTGIGRTGKWFGFQHSEIVPDVMSLAKGLGGGVPIGAIMARGKAAEVFTPGSHGTTFGGNPLVCAAALSVLDTIEQDLICENAQLRGEQLSSLFKKYLHNIDGVVDIRGQGLMIGIELNQSCYELVQIALDHKILINVTADKVVRLLPPLIINAQEIDILAQKLSKIISDFLQ